MPVPFLAALAVPLVIAAPVQRTEAGIRAFFTTVYKGYIKDGPGARLDQPDRYFEPRLAAAIRKDADQAAAKGEMSKMDVDPFCACQDFEAIKPVITGVHVMGATATATVSFTNFGEKIVLEYQLAWTANGWRISDIGGGESLGLRSMYL